MRNVPFYRFKNWDGIQYSFFYKKPHSSHRADGLCSYPRYKNPRIYVRPTLKPKRKLAVIIEEIIHAHLWEELNEKKTRRLAGNIARVLLKSGWKL